jgi:NUMOD3 motif
MKHTAETKRKMSKSHKGIKFTAERKLHMSEAAKRREAKRRADAAKLAEYEAREMER